MGPGKWRSFGRCVLLSLNEEFTWPGILDSIVTGVCGKNVSGRGECESHPWMKVGDKRLLDAKR